MDFALSCNQPRNQSIVCVTGVVLGEVLHEGRITLCAELYVEGLTQ